MKKLTKRILALICIASLLCIALLLLCNQLVVSNAEGRLYDSVNEVENTEVGLLLGTTPQTRIGRRPNQFFKFRIDTAEQLYKAGKIEKILVSGDANSLDGVNEVECMRDSLVARGVPVNVIMLDGSGLRTLDSVVRAVEVYGVHSFVVISQRFHNERAIYLAEHLGLDIQRISGFNAADATSNMTILTYIREYLARVKMFMDIFTGVQPKDNTYREK
ncbi:MAG: YdcF family protein [Bacteroidaceae bacterium]|nr:YdcF family protein [Bacteroidaceae bacterium]